MYTASAVASQGQGQTNKHSSWFEPGQLLWHNGWCCLRPGWLGGWPGGVRLVPSLQVLQVQSRASGSDLNLRSSAVGLGVLVFDLGSWVMDLRGTDKTLAAAQPIVKSGASSQNNLGSWWHSSGAPGVLPEACSFPSRTEALGTIGWVFPLWGTNDIAISRSVSNPTRPATTRHSLRDTETRNLPGACRSLW